MRVSCLGHSSFLLETESGIKIVTDPYESGSYSKAVMYYPIGIQADIVTVSHHHPDHSYTDEFAHAQIIDTSGVFKIAEVEIEGIPSFHDDKKGAARGENIIFIIRADGLTIVHFGDLGTLDIDHKKLKDVDIALVPVGGTFTLGAAEATKLINKLKPKITIPMHFKTPRLGFDIDGVEPFLIGKPDVAKEDFLEVSPKTIKDNKAIVELRYQR